MRLYKVGPACVTSPTPHILSDTLSRYVRPIYNSLVVTVWPTLATKLKSPVLMVLEIGLTWRDAKMFYMGSCTEDDVAGPRSVEPRR